jgi:subtilisin family serine protease
VRLTGIEVRSGAYHAWIERDDPRPLAPVGDRQGWAFPSFFSARSNVDRSSVSTLACAERLISVANLDEVNERIHATSSQGPTRDGRFKPDICAPGSEVVAANGFAGADERWVSMTGTSMASPFVTGVIGLMLELHPTLTSAQAVGILQSTARPLPQATFEWRNDTGFGRIDPEACLREAKRLRQRRDRT